MHKALWRISEAFFLLLLFSGQMCGYYIKSVLLEPFLLSSFSIYLGLRYFRYAYVYHHLCKNGKECIGVIIDILEETESDGEIRTTDIVEFVTNQQKKLYIHGMSFGNNMFNILEGIISG